MNKLCIFLVVAILACATSCNVTPEATGKRFLERGDKFFSDGKYEEASLSYGRAIQKAPQMGVAYYKLGLSELKRGKIPETYRALRRAVQLMPENEDARSKLIDAALTIFLANQGRSKPVRDELAALSGRLLERDPNSYDGWRTKGHLALVDGKVNEAVESFRKANEAKPMQPQVVMGLFRSLILAKQGREGEELALAFLEQEKTNGPVYDALYRYYMSGRRYQAAEEIRKSMVVNNPKNAGARIQLAAHQFLMQKHGEASNTLQSLLDNPSDFPRARLEVGDFYLSIGRVQEALRLFEEGERANPQERAVYQGRKAQAMLMLGKPEEAEKLLSERLQAYPKDDAARTARAVVLARSGTPEKLDQAIAEFRALVGKKPDDTSLRFELGRALQQKGNLDAARAEFLEAFKRQKNHIGVRLGLAQIGLAAGNYKDALQHVDWMLGVRPNDPNIRVLRSVCLQGLGNYKEARAEIVGLLKKYPEFADARIQLGLLDITESRYKEAEAIFRQLYQPGASDLRGLEGLVETYSSQKLFDRAVTLLQEELKKSPRPDAVRRALAVTATRAGNYDLAAEQYRHFLSSNPKSVEMLLRLADVQYRKGDHAAVMQTLQEAGKLAPTHPALLSSYARVQTALGRFGDAMESYRKLLKQRPDSAFTLNNLAYLLADTGGDLDEALSLAQKALQKQPQHPALLDTLALIYIKKHMPDSAIQISRNLTGKHPNNPVYRYHLGMALVSKGQRDEAKAELERALSDQPARTVEVKISGLLAGLK
ncbi:MAG: tetratricopeptide repeat protein [Acidobacteriales bacterium]|nr:tetratricopeptide repeat protein [Terriglobales bacterium]